MLRKLLKYELKATGRLFLPVYVAMIVLAGITRLFVELNLFQNRLAFLPGIAIFLYVMLICAAFVLTFVVMIQRFYKNLLGDEGYLMFTLPVKPGKLIVSKMLTSFLWMAASVAVTLLTVFLLAVDQNTFANMGSFFSALGAMFQDAEGQQMAVLVVEGILLFIGGVFTSILVIYASISLGHLLRSHRVLGAFGAYLVLTVVMQIIITLVTAIPVVQSIPDGFPSSGDMLGWTIGIIMPMYLFMEILFGVGFFFLTKYVFARRLNLE